MSLIEVETELFKKLKSENVEKMPFSLLEEFDNLPPEVKIGLLHNFTLPWHLQFASKAMYALVRDLNVRLCVPVKLGKPFGGGVLLGQLAWLHNHLVRFEGCVSITSLKLHLNVISQALNDLNETIDSPQLRTPYLYEVLMLLFDRYRTEICNVNISFCYSSFKFFPLLFDERMISLTELEISMQDSYDGDVVKAWEVIQKLKCLTKLKWFGRVITRAEGIHPRSLLEYVPQVKCLYLKDDFEGNSSDFDWADLIIRNFVSNRFADKVETCVQEGALTRLTELSIMSHGRGLRPEALTRTTTALAALTSLTSLELGHHGDREDHNLYDATANLHTVRPDMRVYVRY
jgi:hypothetical protein